MFRTDLHRYSKGKLGIAISKCVTSPQIWVIAAYRFGRWYTGLRIPVVFKLPFRLVNIFFTVFARISSGIEINLTADIDKGLFIPHAGTIVIGSGVKIGANCTVCHNVTIGHAQSGGLSDAPIIGNSVYIAPSSVIIGKITIGNHVLIGAGSVVTKSIPDQAVVVGNPAKIINYNGSFGFIKS